MTTTNRAFIKAYRTDEPQAAPANPPLGPAHAAAHSASATAPTSAAAPRAAISTSPPAARTSERSALYGPRTATQSTALQHGAFTPPSAAAESRIRVDHAPTPRPPARTDRPPAASAGEKRPLSSFIAATGIARLDSEPAEGDFFRPGTTVASFQWPEVCRLLARQCADGLNRLADLLRIHAEADRSLVGIIGMSRGRGATTISLALAARLAERSRRVIVVDGNFRSPAIAQSLEVVPTAGWQDVLKHGAPLPDAAIRAQDDRLDVLALADHVPKDIMRLVTGLQAVVTAGVLRHAYDHVIIDAGAFLDSASQPIMLELLRNMGVDAAIAITGPGRADPRDVNSLGDHLARSGCELLGTIENRSLN